MLSTLATRSTIASVLVRSLCRIIGRVERIGFAEAGVAIDIRSGGERAVAYIGHTNPAAA